MDYAAASTEIPVHYSEEATDSVRDTGFVVAVASLVILLEGQSVLFEEDVFPGPAESFSVL
jgi:hypothetical protein